MKWLLAVVLSAGLAFAGAYFWLSARNDAALAAEKAAREQALRAERDRLMPEIQSPRLSAAPGISPIPATVSKNASPAEIIDRLKAMRVGANDQKNPSLRLLAHLLGKLAEQGNGAIPAIKTFLALSEDVNYPSGTIPPIFDNRTSAFSTPSVPTDFLLLPSLRLGLVDVLREIGGQEAQKALQGVLLTSKRGVEVAMVTKALEGMDPGVYRESALSAAKDLLNNQSMVQSPDPLDKYASAYLYYVLKMYNDTSFKESAKGLLISNGSIDRYTMDYLLTVVKDAAVPVLMETYNNPALTNSSDKTALASLLLGFVGQNAQANQMFNDLVTNTNTTPFQRALTVMRLSGVRAGGGAMEVPKDPAQIAAVSGLLSNLSQTTSDPVISKAIKLTLNGLATGKAVDGTTLNSISNGQDAHGRTFIDGLPYGPDGKLLDSVLAGDDGSVIITVTRPATGAAGQFYPGTDIPQQVAPPAVTKPRGPIQVISPGQ